MFIITEKPQYQMILGISNETCGMFLSIYTVSIPFAGTCYSFSQKFCLHAEEYFSVTILFLVAVYFQSGKSGKPS